MQQAPDWQRQTLEINQQRLSIARCGKGPALLLIHGFTDSAACWASLAASLQHEYSIIAYDVRGHGQSNRLQGPFGMTELTQDLIGITEALGLQGRPWIGHSLGAATAFTAAAMRPDLPSALVLEDPPFTMQNATPEQLRPRMQIWRQDLEALSAQPLEAIAAHYREQIYPNWSEIDILPRAAARSQLDLEIFELLDWHSAPDWRETASQISTPTLLLTGDPALGALVTPEVAQEMQTRMAQLSVHQIPDVGHQIRCSALNRTVSVLKEFLQMLPEASQG